MNREICESCGDHPGVINSRYWVSLGEDAGHWVCAICEQEMENEHYDISDRVDWFIDRLRDDIPY